MLPFEEKNDPHHIGIITELIHSFHSRSLSNKSTKHYHSKIRAYEIPKSPTRRFGRWESQVILTQTDPEIVFSDSIYFAGFEAFMVLNHVLKHFRITSIWGRFTRESPSCTITILELRCNHAISNWAVHAISNCTDVSSSGLPKRDLRCASSQRIQFHRLSRTQIENRGV